MFKTYIGRTGRNFNVRLREHENSFIEKFDIIFEILHINDHTEINYSPLLKLCHYYYFYFILYPAVYYFSLYKDARIVLKRVMSPRYLLSKFFFQKELKEKNLALKKELHQIKTSPIKNQVVLLVVFSFFYELNNNDFTQYKVTNKLLSSSIF